ncbi:MAG: hypothetical protein LC745_07755 [Planctomycetia bacterium]|nr:hypothetical protein [Planctomycetia bacterium]
MMKAIEPWRRVWRDGIAPQFGRAELTALRDALRDDDPRLIQGISTMPFAAFGHGRAPEGACVLGFCGWASGGLTSVGEVEEAIGALCFGADARIADKGGCRHFLNWYDETPRGEMRAALLPEVERSLGLLGEIHPRFPVQELTP